MKLKLLVCFLVLAGYATALDMTKYVKAATVAVTNSSSTNITCPLQDATTIQVYIKPSSTAQVYTITLPDASTVEVPSGGYFSLRLIDRMTAGQVVFSVQTATGSANLQVVAMREIK